MLRRELHALRELLGIIRLHWRSLVFVLALALAGGAVSYVLHLQGTRPWLENWLVNFSASMTGIFFILLFIELLQAQRQKDEERVLQETVQREQSETLRRYAQTQALVEMFAADDALARRSIISEMVFHGLMRGAHLRHANLEDAELTGADFSDADLVEARLRGALLRDADLNNADLSGADLTHAKVSIRQLRQARRLEGVTLPDGTRLPEGHEAQAAFERWCDEHRTSPWATT